MNGYVNSTEFANLLGITTGGICHMLKDEELPTPDVVQTQATKTYRYWREDRAKTFAALYHARQRKSRFMVTIPDNICRRLDKACRILGQSRDEVITSTIKAVTA